MNLLEEKLFAKTNNKIISQAEFINFCLYDEQFGYYKKSKTRVGDDGDFFTSSSLKQKVFGELIKCSAKKIIQQHNKNSDLFKFVEIGAEPERTIVENSATIRLGEEIKLSGNVIVISNELLDARPPERFIYKNSTWQKLHFNFSNGIANTQKILLPASEQECKTIERYFSKAKVEEFSLDISFDAIELFENICKQHWNGVLIFADYFRYSTELAEMPSGTLRTYFKHTQGSDIFKNIGDTDITYSPCSCIFEAIAKQHNFAISTKSQASFFIENAAEVAEKIISDNTDSFRKRELCQLISPVHMGECFRILCATRF